MTLLPILDLNNVRVTAIGAGGVASSSGGNFIGGNGGNGAVQFSSILGGTQQYTVGDIALGAGQWRTVTSGTYAIGVNYQNTTGKAMFISYTNFSGGMKMNVGPSISTYVLVDFNDGDSDNDGRSLWVIPNGHYYSFLRIQSNYSYAQFLELY